MILQALYEYYERKAADPDSKIAPEGFEWKEIPFLIVLDREGNFLRFEDTREGEGKKKRAKAFLVPQGEKKAAGIKANFIWDGPEYVLGANPRSRGDVLERHQAFLKRMNTTLERYNNLDFIKPVLHFLNSEPLKWVLEKCAESPEWQEILESNANLTFRIEGLGDLPKLVREIDFSSQTEETEMSGVCLVTGMTDVPIVRLNPSIKGVWGGQPAGGSLVSFQVNSGYDSYGKEKNYNAPLSPKAAFAYTTALNELLGKESSNRLQIGDSSTVFWAQKKDTKIEKAIRSFFANPIKEKDNPDAGSADARQTLQAAITGISPEEKESKFYILGLSPNSARIAVRFWHQGTVAEFARNLSQHLDDLTLVRPKGDEERLGLTYLLQSTVLDWKSDNIPPNLAGNMLRSIMSGSPYPETLLHQCVRRIRADRSLFPVRVAILKAFLNRKLRFKNLTNEKEITVSLDTSNVNPGYRLGRLFAALEKIQEDASPGLNATIRDRFYGAASSSPVSVFPQLLKLKNHHLAKIENLGFKVNHEKRLAEIFDGLGDSMPAHLSMEDQAKFAIGYYHQRQAFFTKTLTAEGEGK